MEPIQLPKLGKIYPNKKKKKKILLLSDDLRMHSGIGTMSKEFVFGTLDKYDWVQLGSAINHPDHGKVMDISADVAKETGIEDAYLKIYPHTGYGNPQVLNELIALEKPDAILHFTDPRFWQWLYNIEHELRAHTPLMYYNIWDDLPYPHWNRPFYESCDLIMNISKQTDNIVKNVLKDHPKEDWAVKWVPHGLNRNKLYPIPTLHKDYEEFTQFQNNFKQANDVDFVIFWNNRNIRRKQPADLILAYKVFCDGLTKEQANKCCLLMHTQLIDTNGTDLPAVKHALCPEYKIIFSGNAVDTKQMNFFYNMSDLTVNIASNEGFGISWCESLHTGTPIVNNVTGGLQDGCRFEDENGDWIEFNTKFPTNHDGTYTNHGSWCKPVFPSNRSLQGSPATPYIFDDRVDFKDVAEAIKYWYNIPKDEREELGAAGREWVLGNESNMSAKGMSSKMAECIDECFVNWTPRKRFTLYKIEQPTKIENPGVII